MRLDLHHPMTREMLGRFEIDLQEQPGSVIVRSPEAGDGSSERDWPLHWDQAVDESGRLQRCIGCGCRELFVRRDFPQRTGLTLVIVAAVASVVLFALGRVALSLGVLFAAVIVDQVISRFTSRCVVCYRCRSEYRKMEISPEIEEWDLAIGEKYRPARVQNADESPEMHHAGS